MGLFKKTETEKVRDDRIARAKEDLEKAKQELAQIPWGSDDERKIAETLRDETLKVVRNMRISNRALKRQWEAFLEAHELKEENKEAEANIVLLRGSLK